MVRIGILSDTHGLYDPEMVKFFENCDEIWHCGDIGSLKVIDAIEKSKALRAVHGNIDGQEIRVRFPEFQAFQVENVRVLMTHIGGYPGKYDKAAIAEIKKYKPTLFICGHSHILKVIYDEQNQLLHINPGAAGIEGFHRVSTLVRFVIQNERIEQLEICELPKNRHKRQYAEE